MNLERTEHRLASVKMLNGKEVTVRSTSEARWANFFTNCGFDWQYEPERFSLSDGTIYTPDFLVTKLDWIECKPTLRHIKESWPRMQKFISEYCQDQTGYKSNCYAFINSEPPLTLDNNVLFKDGKIYRPNCHKMGTLLLDALDLDEIHWCRINNALRLSSEWRANRMLPIRDIIRFELDRMINGSI